MKVLPGLLMLAAAPLYGGAIDITARETAIVRTGDTVSFDILTGSYALNALTFGLPANPSDVSFSLVTSPLITPTQFAATVTSSDASIELALDGILGFMPSYFSSADFQGTVSTLNGHLNIASSSSAGLFAGGTLHLNLTNQGSDLTLGLSPLTFGQDLFVTLSGGPLSVGAYARSVTLERPDTPLLLAGRFDAAVATVPEPDSAWFFVSGGGLFCAISGILKRVLRGRD
jgi:hypothetical protein